MLSVLVTANSKSDVQWREHYQQPTGALSPASNWKKQTGPTVNMEETSEAYIVWYII